VIVIGFDPGLANTGFSVVEKKSNDFFLIDAGVINPNVKDPLEIRIHTIFNESLKIIKKYHPSYVAIENVFFGKNVQSAIKLGQAKAAIMLAATDLEIRLVDYTPREIKQSITGNGSASKDQVEFMVKKIFKLNEGFNKKDISDAIAISWCALNRI